MIMLIECPTIKYDACDLIGITDHSKNDTVVLTYIMFVIPDAYTSVTIQMSGMLIRSNASYLTPICSHASLLFYIHDHEQFDLVWMCIPE